MVAVIRLLIEGSTLGLATGHICLATCGPVYAPFLVQKERTLKRQFLTVLEISLGRFIMYLLVGAAAGAFGRQIAGIQREYFSFTAYILFSLYLVISALRSHQCEGGCAVGKWNRFAEWPFLLGILTGINICPSFLLAFSRSFTVSGPFAGMLFFAAFFAGTSIFLVPLSFVGLLGYKRHFRTVARVAAVGVAAWFISNAGVIGIRLAKPFFDKRPVISLMDEHPMYVAFADPERACFFASELAKHRDGPVILADTLIAADAGYYYVLTDTNMLADTTTGAPFRKAGVFVTVVGDKYITGPDSVGTVVAFLEGYHFLFDTKKGDLFFIR